MVLASRAIWIALLLVVVSSLASAAGLTEVWRASGFDLPESVSWDAKAKAFYVSEQKWQAMSADQRKAVQDAAKEAGDFETEQFRAQEAEAVKVLGTKMEVIEPDVASIRAKLQGAFDSFDGSLWPKGTVDTFKKLMK